MPTDRKRAQFASAESAEDSLCTGSIGKSQNLPSRIWTNHGTWGVLDDAGNIKFCFDCAGHFGMGHTGLMADILMASDHTHYTPPMETGPP